MKKILFVSAFLLSIFALEAQTAKISVAELPVAARTFLSQYYKYRPIEFVRRKDVTASPYEVKLAQGTQIKFCDNGDWCQVNNNGSSLPKGLVPENIESYVRENYPKKRITYIEKDADGIEVSLNGKVSLAFDQKGNPVQQ